MTDVVFAWDGLLDKYIGDSVMALWGAPFPAPDHARQACCAALAMIARLDDLRSAWNARGVPSLDLGISINTGPMVVGNFGSPERFTYTAVGDHVNLGARLKQLNKIYGTHILISEFTRQAIGDAFAVRQIDLVRVRGRNHPVTVYELLGPAGRSSVPADLLQGFAAGLAAYARRDWVAAGNLFADLTDRYPDDGPSRIYRDRCRLFAANPPAADWDGVFLSESLTATFNAVR